MQYFFTLTQRTIICVSQTNFCTDTDAALDLNSEPPPLRQRASTAALSTRASFSPPPPIPWQGGQLFPPSIPRGKLFLLHGWRGRSPTLYSSLHLPCCLSDFIKAAETAGGGNTGRNFQFSVEKAKLKYGNRLWERRVIAHCPW